jgi:hypothetical protein
MIIQFDTQTLDHTDRAILANLLDSCNRKSEARELRKESETETDIVER